MTPHKRQMLKTTSRPYCHMHDHGTCAVEALRERRDWFLLLLELCIFPVMQKSSAGLLTAHTWGQGCWNAGASCQMA